MPTTATKPQLQKLHVLLRQRGIDDETKREIIGNYTNGRTTSSRELTFEEIKNWISQLEKADPRQPIRRIVFSLAYDAGIIYGHTDEDKKMNAAKLDMFLTERGSIKKKLIAQTLQELQKTITQFKAIIKHNEESKAKKVTDVLLSELNILTSKR